MNNNKSCAYFRIIHKYTFFLCNYAKNIAINLSNILFMFNKIAKTVFFISQSSRLAEIV